MSVTHGMNPEEVHRLAQVMRGCGQQLEQLSTEIDGELQGAGWSGIDSDQFREAWLQYRAEIRLSAQSLIGLGHAADNNASDQETASGVAGVGSHLAVALASGGSVVGLAGLARGVDNWTRRANRHVSLAGTASGIAMLADKAPWIAKVNTGASVFGYGTEGARVVRELTDGSESSAALTASFVAMDAAGDQAKSKGVAGYLVGVNLNMWADVGRAAREIDWSPEGVAAIRNASLGDWVQAYKDTDPREFVSVIDNLLPGRRP
jgi:uncharacterized protein YukE